MFSHHRHHPGSGFHWDSAMLSDITIDSEETLDGGAHAQGGLVPRRRRGP